MTHVHAVMKIVQRNENAQMYTNVSSMRRRVCVFFKYIQHALLSDMSCTLLTCARTYALTCLHVRRTAADVDHAYVINVVTSY